MGFWTRVGARVVVDGVSRISFARGQQGQPPLNTFSDTPVGERLRKIADDAYDKGQKSVLVKIGKKIAGE